MSRQFRIALLVELIILLGLLSLGFFVWRAVCQADVSTCFKDNSIGSSLGFLLLSSVRPLFFSPIGQAAYIAGTSFPLWQATLLTALGSAFSALILYYPGHLIGKKIVRPWLSNNLPSTWRLLRTQDFKIIFFTRWCFLPFDIFSLLFGVADFHARRVFIFTFIGSLPEVYFFARMGQHTPDGILTNSLTTLSLAAFFTLTPLLAYEFVMRKRGSGLWISVKKVYVELRYEAQVNNEISKTAVYSADRTPVILIYGFFSSRKTLSVMENLLTREGFDVMSFNLGGSLGVFFTRGIQETAEFIDRKIQRQMKRHGFKKVHIVAHSKGGLVALWWALRLGGAGSCDKLITMGTPFKGSWLTYLAIFSGLGFFWKDVWQMRPGSPFLQALHESPVYPNLKIYNFYSREDRVAVDKAGIFDYPGQVESVPLHHLSHFQFLARRDVANVIVKILRDETIPLAESLEVPSTQIDASGAEIVSQEQAS